MVETAQPKWEYGDFQTPHTLATVATGVLSRLGIKPRTVIEPTCGTGAFLLAALYAFPNAERFIGLDINHQYIQALEQQILPLAAADITQLIHGDFFSFDWEKLIANLPEPLLILGNPPWVTNSKLGVVSSANLPNKSNFKKQRGYDAITGKSNFDISEWMLLHNLSWLKNRCGTIAQICKTSVARKILLHIWKQQLSVNNTQIFLLDARKYFRVSVDACLLIIHRAGATTSLGCAVFSELTAKHPAQSIGYYDAMLISNIDYFKKWQHLNGNDSTYTWRSGIKHDCSKIMELERSGDKYRNGLGELVTLEDGYVYPMLKSADLGNIKIRYGRKFMLVTQQYVGQDTMTIKNTAPYTWSYLELHVALLEKRASSIYRKHPKYSIFGVGAYAFAAWKVAISGFYKKLSFKVVEPYQGRAVVFDDTVYFLPCCSEAEAQFISELLNSAPAQEFFTAMIFWADKRPITIEILKRLNLRALSIELGCEDKYLRFAYCNNYAEDTGRYRQLSLGTIGL